MPPQPPDAYAFTRHGGYSSTFPTNGYTTSVDIYLDMTKATGGDRRFDWSSAINKPDGTHGRDFIFNVGSYADAPGTVLVSASNNAPGDPTDRCRSVLPPDHGERLVHLQARVQERRRHAGR